MRIRKGETERKKVDRERKRGRKWIEKGKEEEREREGKRDFPDVSTVEAQ